MYSASVLEGATEVCFFELQLTTAPPSMKTKPDMGLRSFTLLAQSAPTKPRSAVPPRVPEEDVAVTRSLEVSERAVKGVAAPEFAECRPRAAAVYARSGRVPSMGYMSALMALWCISGEVSLVKLLRRPFLRGDGLPAGVAVVRGMRAQNPWDVAQVSHLIALFRGCLSRLMPSRFF